MVYDTAKTTCPGGAVDKVDRMVRSGGEPDEGGPNSKDGHDQGGMKYFTSWEPILSATNFARNSVSQRRQKTSKIAVIWVFLPVTKSF